MKTKAKLIFLGTGGSLGVPVPCCPCSVCNSTSTYNQRSRPSAVLQIEDKNFLIDAGSDLRSQVLREKITTLEGVILTHTHHDHASGFDDLRAFYFHQKKPVDVLLSKESYIDFEDRYHYLVKQKKEYPSKFSFKILEDDFGKTSFKGLSISHVSYLQANMKVLGLRSGSFAYITDIKEYTSQIIDALQGVETLVVSALRYSESPVHLSIDDAIIFSQKVGARNTYFTHIAHDVDHETVSMNLPNNVYLAYDGQTIDVEVDFGS